MRARLSRFLLLLVTLSSPALAADHEAVILRTTGTRDALRRAVLAVGGTVSAELQNVNAIAATVPAGALAALGALPDVKLEKDALVAPPSPHDPTGLGHGVVELGAADAILPSALSGGQVIPNDYLFNNKLIRANVVQATGNIGTGVIVAIIDSGTANAAKVASIRGSVIGGQSFVPAAADPVTSATSTSNGPHGTWVGSVIAGHAAFGFLSTSPFAQAVRTHAPDSFIDGSVYGRPDLTFIPLVGVAPGASLYALKVFRSTGGSAYTSWIMAALDRVLTLKKNFQAGVPSVPVSGTGTEDDPYLYDSLDIGVVNLSLGGPTLAAGRDLEDQLVQQLLEAGVTVANSAGNSGFSGLTTGSPSTSLAAISSAAATTPAHERILWSLVSGNPAVGYLYRPSDAIQTAYFSSRGPTADGRVGVSVITAGDYNFVQAPSGSFNFVSGTSFSAPTVAGAAALLRAGVPKASATQVRNAIIGSANPKVLGDNSSRFDQGAGFLDVEAALKLLKGGRVSTSIPTSSFTNDVAENLERAGLRTRELSPGGTYRQETGSLLPGERQEYYLKLDDHVGGLQLEVLGVTRQRPASQQNQLFGDDVVVQVQNAKTSTDDLRYFSFAKGAESATLKDLDTGVIRLTFLGDWSNAGRAGATFSVTALPKQGKKVFDTQGTIADGEWIAIPVTIPVGTATARFELSWKGDWGAYPTNDIDLVVVDPAGNENWDGATLNSPERTTLVNPAPGEYQVLVNGYTVFGSLVGDHETGSRAAKTDRYKLSVYLE